MLLERIDKMMNKVNICNVSKGLTPVSLQEVSRRANCSRFDHVKLDFLVMAIQEQGMYRQGPSRGSTQQGHPNYPRLCTNCNNNLVINNNPLQHVGFRRKIDHTYPPSYNSQQKFQQPYANQR